METLTLMGLLLAVLILLFIGYLVGKKIGDMSWEQRVPGIREEAVKKSRAVIGGQFSEQLAPYLPDFPYKPTEARFIGKPIDFIIFNGMDDKEIKDVVFLEVKSGKSALSTPERRLRDAVKNKKVRWELYQIPEDLTSRKEN